MYPVLWQIPLPAWILPLSPTLVALAAVGVLLVLLGWRYRATDLTLIGALAALGGSLAALFYKGHVAPLTEVPVSSYGAALCLALLVGWYLTLRLGERDGLSRELLAAVFLVTALSGFVGARALYVLVNSAEIASISEAFNARRGGLTGYGALLAGFVGSFLWLRWRKASFWAWADAVAPSLAMGVVLTRIGAYLLGSDFGRPLPAGAPKWLARLGTFPHWPPNVFDGAGAPAWVHQVNQGLIPLDAAKSLPVHPTELYEALAGAGLVVLSVLARRYRRTRGQIFCLWVFAYGVVRWVLDAWRDDPERGWLGPYVSEHRYLPLGLLVLGLGWALGPSRAISRSQLRHAARALGFLPAPLAYVALAPPAFAPASPVQISISQWLALISALAAALGFWWLCTQAPIRTENGTGSASSSGMAKRRNREVSPP